MIEQPQNPQLNIPVVTSSVLFSRVWEMPNSNTFDIKCIRKLIDKYLIKEWDSTKSASIFYKVSTSCICACINGKSKTAIGFVWSKK